jgi:hypothetical protein
MFSINTTITILQGVDFGCIVMFRNNFIIILLKIISIIHYCHLQEHNHLKKHVINISALDGRCTRYIHLASFQREDDLAYSPFLSISSQSFRRCRPRLRIAILQSSSSFSSEWAGRLAYPYFCYLVLYFCGISRSSFSNLR